MGKGEIIWLTGVGVSLITLGVVLLYWCRSKVKPIFTSRLIPLTDLLNEAEIQGWGFSDYGNQQICEFIYALRDAGSTGDVQFWGRRKGSNDPVIAEISALYWLDFLIDGVSCLDISRNDGLANGVSTNNDNTSTKS